MFLFTISFLTYLLLSWPEGLNILELATALIFAFLIALTSPGARLNFGAAKGLNPIRWWLFLSYIFSNFFSGFLQAAVDMAYRVISGDINPGITQIQPRLKSSTAKMLMTNVLNLTPGTLVLDVEDDGYFTST